MADGPGPTTLSLPGIEDLQLIGRGGSATLYRGRQQTFHRDVAVKVLDAVDDAVAARFSKELRAIGSLSGHHHVVPVYEAGELDGRPYLVMPYLSGGSLADRLRSGALPPAEVRRVGLAVADALTAAHALGMLHRDVKPANVLFNAYGEAQLADFGIARFSDATQTHGLVAATVGYAAPEVLAGEPASPAADVYSLGATLHAALRGAPPFTAQPGEAPIAFAVRVMQSDPPPLDGAPPAPAAVVRRAMAKDPGQRFATAEAMTGALRDAEVVAAAPVGPTERLVRPAVTRTRRQPRGRRRVAAAAGAGALAVLGAVVAVLALIGSGAPASRHSAGRAGPSVTTPPSRPPATTATTAGTVPSTPVTAATTPAAATTTPTVAAGRSGSVDAYVRSYYDLVNAHSLSQSWTWLSPSYQQRLGYSYYQHFWDSVRSVDVMSVSPGSDQATISIRYDMTNGATQTERALLSFVTVGGRRLIDNTQVVG